MAGVEDIVGKTGNYNVRDKFKRFDNKFIRPRILKNVQVCYAPPPIEPASESVLRPIEN